MRKLAVLCTLLAILGLCSLKASGQDAKSPEATAKTAEGPIHFYHLEFVVQELGSDGKPANSRTYTVDTNTDRANREVSIRTGSRVPVSTGEHQVQYIDLGVNLDVHSTREVEGKLALNVTADISSLANPASAGQSSTPVIRSNRWQAPVLVSLNRPTIIFTSDSLDSKGNMQIQLTAKPIQ